MLKQLPSAGFLTVALAKRARLLRVCKRHFYYCWRGAISEPHCRRSGHVVCSRGLAKLMLSDRLDATPQLCTAGPLNLHLHAFENVQAAISGARSNSQAAA